MAELLAEDGRSEVGFVGTPGGVEARLVSEAGVRFYGLPARGFDRARPWTLVTASVILAISAIRALLLMRRFQPDVVVGFGGYVSIPVGLAAVVSGRPLVLHEQNSVPGLANRVLSRWAHSVGVTYESSVAYLKHPGRAILTGNPVRPAVLAGDRALGRVALGVAPDATMLLVFGGSRGARHINQAVIDGKDALLALENVSVVHIAGRSEGDTVRRRFGEDGREMSPRYAIHDYIDEMGSALAASDLVVSRAGATSIAEVTALGIPSVLVPFPFATDDHQTKNAKAVAEAGGAMVLPDAELDSPAFIETVTALLADADKRATMAAASRSLGHPDAGQNVADMVRAAASGHASDERKGADS